MGQVIADWQEVENSDGASCVTLPWMAVWEAGLVRVQTFPGQNTLMKAARCPSCGMGRQYSSGRDLGNQGKS